MLTSVRLGIVLSLMQCRCTVCIDVRQALKSFWTHPMELIGDVGHVESCYSLFGDSLSVGAR
jgi:hypothetical protein